MQEGFNEKFTNFMPTNKKKKELTMLIIDTREH